MPADAQAAVCGRQRTGYVREHHEASEQKKTAGPHERERGGALMRGEMMSLAYQ